MAKKILLYMFVSFLAAGCSSGVLKVSLPEILADEPSGQVFVIRESSLLLGSGVKFAILLDGSEVFKVGNGKYTKFPLAPGEYTISVLCFGGGSPTWKQQDQFFFLENKDEVYFSVSDDLMACARMQEIGRDSALTLMKKYPEQDLSF